MACPWACCAGRANLMRRYRRGARGICLARGTFNAHPYVMGAMLRFLRHIETHEVHELNASQDDLWMARRRSRHQRAPAARPASPIPVAGLAVVWTFLYEAAIALPLDAAVLPARPKGLSLSWVGTGRSIFSLDYTDREFDDVAERIVAAAAAMERAGWWATPPTEANAALRRRVLRELLQARWRAWVRDPPARRAAGRAAPGSRA